MPFISQNLNLPYIAPAQAQKHVTHNEALRALDAIVQLSLVSKSQTTPPATPVEGSRYFVATIATGTWENQDSQIAAYQDGAWAFYAPQSGWQAWIEDESSLQIWDGTTWQNAAPVPDYQNLAQIGINTTADVTNRLSVSSPATLLTHAGNGHQLKLNKNATVDTSSILYQSNWSGRAEIGLTGDDDFHFKVSSDGSSWHEGLVIDKDNGGLKSVTSINSGPLGGMRNKVINARFDIWQRGAVFSANGYTADRFYCGNIDGGGGAATISRQAFMPGQTDVPGEPEFYYQHNQTSASSTQALFGQKIEGVRTLAGQTVTLSFWARVTSGTLALTPYWTQNFGAGGSADVNLTDASQTLTTVWQKFSITRDMAAISGKTIGAGNYLSLELLFPASSVFAVQIANVQIERGGTATEFEQRYHGQELSLCQRYYTQISGVVLVAVSSVSGTYPSWLFPTTMRANPAMSYTYSGGSGATYVVSREGFYQSGNHSIDSGFSLKADAEL
ncbi:MAG: DUF2793 domain-containing protein [Robiginitomaculum sp.]|nr:DUF2793 domain-containing protein [Robiginitomaculum sp.]